MILEELEFLNTLERISQTGIISLDRTGVGTRFEVGVTLKYDLTNGRIPIWTTRKIKWENQAWELIWFLRGQTDVKFLTDRGVNIWNSWVKADGTIGPGYGQQWRRFADYRTVLHDCTSGRMEYNEIDQFKNLIEGIKKNPESRRHMVSLWNPADVDHCVLPPCHGDIIQFVVEDKQYLHCLQYQRSADMAIGYCPWQYALLTNIVAKLTGLEAKSLTVTVGNAHVYMNQMDAVKEQTRRTPTEFPTLDIKTRLACIEDVEDSKAEDYALVNYTPQPFIKFPIAV